MTTKTYNVGIYCRLSNDDERDGESVSIENQKLLLQNYVRQRGWNEVDTYIDDGYSGTNFDRPGVKRLIEDAKAKRINVILVKDLSRFGRNYIEFGQYTDYLFPSLGCRFIALNNGIDTESTNGSTDVMCFLNLFNEFYSRDTSKKVKAVKKACAENGKFMGTYPAYGYKRDPADKHHLVIDEDTAPIVRRIFEMRAAGTGFHAIAVILNEEGIPSPGGLSRTHGCAYSFWRSFLGDRQPPTNLHRRSGPPSGQRDESWETDCQKQCLSPQKRTTASRTHPRPLPCARLLPGWCRANQPRYTGEPEPEAFSA